MAPAAPTLPAPDAAIAMLASLLGEATVQQAPPSLLARLSGQLATLLQATTARLASLLPGGDAAPGARAELAAPARADAPMPQPPPPPPAATPLGPVLTLDPRLGTIVTPETPDAAPGRTTEPGTADGDGSIDSERQPLLPSAWVPIAGLASGRAVRRHLGTLVDRIEALLAETGITRMQLLLLLVLAPLATAFLIDVVASILRGG